MRVRIALALTLVFLSHSLVHARGADDKAFCVGGTTTDFQHLKNAVAGDLKTDDEKLLTFQFTDELKQERSIVIPYDQIVDLAYQRNMGCRWRTAVAAAASGNAAALAQLFARRGKHFLTVGFKDQDGNNQCFIFALGNDIVRNKLVAIQERSGKYIRFHSE